MDDCACHQLLLVVEVGEHELERFQEEGGAHEMFVVSAREQLPPVHFTDLNFSDLVKQFPVIPYRDIYSESEDEVEVKEEGQAGNEKGEEQ